MDAQLIRRSRELVGESQAAFGVRFGVDQSTVHRWEKHGPPPRGPGRVALEREVKTILDAHGEGTEGESSCDAA